MALPAEHPSEFPRKVVHAALAAAAAALPVLTSFRVVVAVAVASIPLLVWARRVNLFAGLYRVQRSSWGEIYFAVGVALAAALVPRQAAYACGVLVMGISDAAAGLAGQRYGRRGYRLLGSRKTVAGSAVFFVTAAVIFSAALTARDGFSVAGVAAAVGCATVVTAAEACLTGGADNAVLPVLGAVLADVA